MRFRIGQPRRRSGDGRRGFGIGRGGSFKARLMIAAVMAAIALFTYFMNQSDNPYTGQSERVSLTPQQEVAMGLQAKQQLIPQFGGRSDDARAQRLVEEVGRELIVALELEYGRSDHPYEFSFTLLNDEQTVNAFALPGGPMFITEALLNRMTSRAQLVGVMGHELAHVIERHSAERMAKQELGQGLTGAAVAAAGDMSAGQVAQMVNNFVQMSYGRQDELESDRIGLQLMVQAGYDPREMIEVMKILKEASGGASQPEWASTHPDPGNRIAQIESWIATEFPEGVPDDLRVDEFRTVGLPVAPRDGELQVTPISHADQVAIMARLRSGCACH